MSPLLFTSFPSGEIVVSYNLKAYASTILIIGVYMLYLCADTIGGVLIDYTNIDV